MHIQSLPINKAVTEQWHKEHCEDHSLQYHEDERHAICSACGNFVQFQVKK